MPQSEPVTILLVNAIAEEIKLLTLNFRRFFPNCHVEVVYTAEEALQWGQRAAWQLILFDENLLADQAASIFLELKRLAPYATFVLQTDQSDSTALFTPLPVGADFILHKRSPTFLTELTVYTNRAIETRTIRMTLQQTQERHRRLVDILSDGLYELDVNGLFVYVSPRAAEILGYAQSELIGTPYSAVVAPDQQDHARHHFNDRRAGARAARRIEVDLIRKSSINKPPQTRVRTEISARGLYDLNRRYLGTLGLLRDLSQHRRQAKTIDQLEHQLRESDRLLAVAQRVSILSKTLHAPHNAIQAQSQRLLKTIRDAHLIEQIDSLATYTAEAIQLGEELTKTTAKITTHRDTINDIIESVLTTTQASLLDTNWIERAYGQNLPPFTGNLESMTDLLRMLLSHARRHVATLGSFHRLQISTAAIGPTGASIDLPTSMHSQAMATEFQIHIQETDMLATSENHPLETARGDFFEIYGLIKRLGGRWEFLAPVNGFLSMTVWIPVEQFPRLDDPVGSSMPLVSSASNASKPFSEGMRPTPSPAMQAIHLHSILQTKPLPDRRTNNRTAIGLPARITIGNTLYEGILIDIGSGGAFLEVKGTFPSFEQQPVYLLLKTAVDIFELNAIAHDRRQADIGQGRSRLALEFAALSEERRKVLTSFLETARIRAFTITVEAQFPLFERPDDWGTTFTEAAPPDKDHRESIRVQVSLPVRIETSIPASGPLTGFIINLSRSGACLQTKLSLKATSEIVVLHLPLLDPDGQPKARRPEAPETILTGHIVHLSHDPTVPSELTPGASQPEQRIGIRFSKLTLFAEREINRVLAQYIDSSMGMADPDARPLIVSNRWECRNPQQHIIAVTSDHARHHNTSPDTPIVIIASGFGLTQTDYVSLAFYLAANRLRVIRYDHSHHIGQSDGNILQMTLRTMQADLQSVLHFVHTTWPTAPVALLAEDIAARVAVKAIAQSRASDQLFLLDAVLDIETALSLLAQHNVIDAYRQGVRGGVVNLWGFNVDIDKFLDDAIMGGYVDVASSAADCAQLVTLPIFLTSPQKSHSTEHLFGPQQRSLHAMKIAPTIVSLPADLSGESGIPNERRAETFKMVLNMICTHLTGNPAAAQIREPSPREIRQQQRLEHERIRTRYPATQVTRTALWGTHLAHLSQLETVPDHATLTDDLYRLLLPLEPGMTVLDIGCSPRSVIRHMLTNHAYRSAYQGRQTDVPLRYIGADQSYQSLKHAERLFHTSVQELPATLTSTFPMADWMTTSWIQTDWKAPLPFTDGSIARVLCHLSLSFAPSPLSYLRQILRVLHSDGIAVVTCFQSHTDISTLFRRHLRTTNHDAFGSPARSVLHYFGRLREATRHGVLQTYERDKLTSLLTHAGSSSIQLLSVLDNQLLLALVRKTKSAG